MRKLLFYLSYSRNLWKVGLYFYCIFWSLWNLNQEYNAASMDMVVFELGFYSSVDLGVSYLQVLMYNLF